MSTSVLFKDLDQDRRISDTAPAPPVIYYSRPSESDPTKQPRQNAANEATMRDMPAGEREFRSIAILSSFSFCARY